MQQAQSSSNTSVNTAIRGAAKVAANKQHTTQTIFIPARQVGGLADNQTDGNVIHHFVARTLWLAVIIVLLGAIFVSSAQAQQANIERVQINEQQTHAEEPRAGTLMLRSEHSLVSAVSLDASVQMSISGMIAAVKFEQAFDNDSGNWVEGIYSFPLPEDAAVKSLLIRVGERVIEGRIREREEARQIYQQAADNGQVASLVSQQRANFFTTRIANIAPGEEVHITLEYIQTLQYRDDQYSVRLPTTFTPRYTNGLADDNAEITPPQAVDGEISAPYFTLEININSQLTLAQLESPSHALTITEQAGLVNATFPQAVPMDKDFILTWSASISDFPAINTFTETVDADQYAISVLMPPLLPDNSRGQPRELVLVIDTSGSMGGASIRSAKSALQMALQGLQEQDLFNIIEFNSATSSLWQHSQSASDQNIAKASRFIRRLVADGGTEMEPAMRQALSNPTDGYLRQIVFVTDGAVGYEDRMFRMIKRELAGARLFTVGIGSSPNSYFMRKAAEAGRGTFTYIAMLADVRREMEQLFARLESPVLTNLALEWIGAAADFTPSPLQDLYLGEPAVIAAKLSTNTSGFILRGDIGNAQWEETVNFESSTPGTGISTVWARQKIESLLDEQRNHNSEQHKSEITAIALSHGLVSPYTSLVAVEEMPVRPAQADLQTKKIPNLLPQGSSMQAINLPAGASGADTLAMMSLISALLALVVFQLFLKMERRNAVV